MILIIFVLGAYLYTFPLKNLDFCKSAEGKIILLHKEIVVGDKIKAGERIGEVIKIDHRPSASILKVSFCEGPARDFVSPPTKIEKILSPLERLEANITKIIALEEKIQ